MRFFFPQRRLLSISTMKSQSLSEFLFTNRQRYFDALKADKPRDWTVVVGNEAGGEAPPIIPSSQKINK